MKFKNQRSRDRSDLWFILRRHQSGARALAVSACAFLVSLTTPASAQSDGPLELAEVEAFRYVKPPADLQLDEAGERKRKALGLFYRGICLEDSDMEEALKLFQQVIELDPSNLELATETATHYAVFGRFDEALAILEKSLEQNPDERDAYLNLARYCDAHNNGDEALQEKAVEYAKAAVEKFPTDEVAIEFLARIYVERGEKKSAVEVLETALAKEDVRDGAYWLTLANIAREVWPMREEENREKVLEIYRKAILADPENLDIVERVAQFYRASGETEQAVRLYQELVKRSPERLSARADLADLYWQASEFDAAIGELESLVQIVPSATDIRRKLTDMYLAMKDLPKAIEHGGQIIEAGDGGVADFLKLGELQRVADRPGGALRTLREGAAMYPDSPELSYSLGRLYLGLDRFAEAYDSMVAAEAKAQSAQDTTLDDAFYFDFAVTAERSGKRERAEELFAKSIEMAPEGSVEGKASSLNYLGYMWLESEKNIDQAGEMIKEANELMPDNAAYLDSLGWYYFLKDDFETAIKHLLRARELMGDAPDSVIFEHLARAYFASGDTVKAREFAEQALELDPDKAELEALKRLIEDGEA